MVVQLLQTPIKLKQEVLPLRALAIGFAAELQEQRQEVFGQEAFVGAIVGGKQRSFERTRRRSVGVEQGLPAEFGATHWRPPRSRPLSPQRPRVGRAACCGGRHIAWQAGRATTGGSGSAMSPRAMTG